MSGPTMREFWELKQRVEKLEQCTPDTEEAIMQGAAREQVVEAIKRLQAVLGARRNAVNEGDCEELLCEAEELCRHGLGEFVKAEMTPKAD